MKKAVILLSGGLDSSTCLAIANNQGFDCHALSFSYGQRHAFELKAAKSIAIKMGVTEHRIIHLDKSAFSGSALTDPTIDVPSYQPPTTIPITYVPARNTLFLAFALGYAESIHAFDIFIGANAIDYSNYPDCRPQFIKAFQQLANVATKTGVEGHPIIIHAPLMQLTKAEIIKTGLALNVDYSLTVSCYQLSDKGAACGHCDSCVLRQQGFKAAKINDPTRYQ